MKSRVIPVLLIVVVVACCCLILAAGGYTLSELWPLFTAGVTNPEKTAITPDRQPVSTGQVSPVPTRPESHPEPVTPSIANTTEQGRALELQRLLAETTIPIHNRVDLAGRFKGIFNAPLTVPAPLIKPVVGDSRDFWVTNMDTNEVYTISASLQYISPHIYFWVGDGIRYDRADLVKLADTFENHIYPDTRNFFGSEWYPGVDNDPHIYILLGSDLGYGLAGYFSSTDEYIPLIQENSNASEIFVLNADGLDLAEEFTYGVLAHEFQHMIHWYQDLNEDTWLNEGFAELAMEINGYETGGFDFVYLINPDIQLNHWSDDLSENDAHYGGSYLFTTYFLERYGRNMTRKLFTSQENGFDSLDAVFSANNTVDPLTGDGMTADLFFADWAVANILNDRSAEDGQFAYNAVESAFTSSEKVTSCAGYEKTDTVSQYGVDYIEIECPGKQEIQFQGAQLVDLLPENVYAGDYAFWSFRGDESDMTLTREFDFTGISGGIELAYQTWYDLEEDYDYAYVEVSTDGVDWVILDTPSGTDRNVAGNSYGWGYNGTTDGWIEERVDLSDYAGEVIQLRFEYITDAAVNGEGLMLDEVSIPAIDYHEGFEEGDGGWQAAGFVRVSNQVPQTYALTLVTIGDEVKVQRIPLDGENRARIAVDFSDRIRRAILVISGTSRHITTPAYYSLEIK